MRRTPREQELPDCFEDSAQRERPVSMGLMVAAALQRAAGSFRPLSKVGHAVETSTRSLEDHACPCRSGFVTRTPVADPSQEFDGLSGTRTGAIKLEDETFELRAPWPTWKPNSSTDFLSFSVGREDRSMMEGTDRGQAADRGIGRAIRNRSGILTLLTFDDLVRSSVRPSFTQSDTESCQEEDVHRPSLERDPSSSKDPSSSESSMSGQALWVQRRIDIRKTPREVISFEKSVAKRPYGLEEDSRPNICKTTLRFSTDPLLSTSSHSSQTPKVRRRPTPKLRIDLHPATAPRPSFSGLGVFAVVRKIDLDLAPKTKSLEVFLGGREKCEGGRGSWRRSRAWAAHRLQGTNEEKSWKVQRRKGECSSDACTASAKDCTKPSRTMDAPPEMSNTAATTGLGPTSNDRSRSNNPSCRKANHCIARPTGSGLEIPSHARTSSLFRAHPPLSTDRV
ncbi:hypothetical protein BDK51DRAFT_49666 [Blyttiomyces helicus]|uniref:Uncharacterized protein n=1 Tax=Blyttiomyces helicus TaxID=388810 RepID=A0A4V1IPM1_9FUNG|nr:hypothetical protein BDK51DRAFT_49666 [Blyttiomyces helicus]|eukprot:RKO83537.1 hypothetical protein BDK51DRAFT_49666 [Blyttiomyces helicus]